MSVPSDTGNLVDSLRASVAPDAGSGLPAPHVTLLFVGFPDETMVQRLKSAFEREPEPRIEVELDGWGIFRRDDDTRNIHFRVKPHAELLALHTWAIDTCRRLSWVPPGETNGGNYRPHITIADGRLDADPLLAALGKLDITGRITLREIHFRAHPLKA